MDNRSFSDWQAEDTSSTSTDMLGNIRNSHEFPTAARKYKSILFYSTLLVITVSALGTTLYAYPLFPLQYDSSLAWTSRWLLTTVLDYYGASLCLGGIVLTSESTWTRGVCWNLGFALLGSPLCCLWIILWLRKGGTLQLRTCRNM